jgi:hypothetical protein
MPSRGRTPVAFPGEREGLVAVWASHLVRVFAPSTSNSNRLWQAAWNVKGACELPKLNDPTLEGQACNWSARVGSAGGTVSCLFLRQPPAFHPPDVRIRQKLLQQLVR